MEPDPDLRHLLDQSATSAPPDQLRAIVRRAGRRTARLAGAGAVVLLGLGGLGGYLIAHSDGSSRSVVQTAGPETPALSPGGGEAARTSASSAVTLPTTTVPVLTPGLTPTLVGGSYVHDLTRTTGQGVTLRVFQPTVPQPTVAQSRVVEVSTSGMIGTTLAGIGNGTGAVATVLGTAERAPVVVVTAWTSATVAVVRWSGEGKGDAMAPSGHFVVLAVPVSAAPEPGAALGTLTFIDGAGRQLQSEPIYLNRAVPVCSPSAPLHVSIGGAATASPKSWSSGEVCASAGSSVGSGSSTSGSTGSSGGQCVPGSANDGTVKMCGTTSTASPPTTGEAQCRTTTTGTPAITSSLKVNCAELAPAVAPASG